MSILSIFQGHPNSRSMVQPRRVICTRCIFVLVCAVIFHLNRDINSSCCLTSIHKLHTTAAAGPTLSLQTRMCLGTPALSITKYALRVAEEELSGGRSQGHWYLIINLLEGRIVYSYSRPVSRLSLSAIISFRTRKQTTTSGFINS